MTTAQPNNAFRSYHSTPSCIKYLSKNPILTSDLLLHLSTSTPTSHISYSGSSPAPFSLVSGQLRPTLSRFNPPCSMATKLSCLRLFVDQFNFIKLEFSPAYLSTEQTLVVLHVPLIPRYLPWSDNMAKHDLRRRYKFEAPSFLSPTAKSTSL